MSDALRAAMDAEPQLTALVEQYGHEAVWLASEEAIGCPPTWGLGTESLVRVLEVLQSKFQTRKG